MPRGGQVIRWVTILEELRASRLGVPAEVLAERHSWKARTVYRDLRALQDAGVPLTSAGGRWKLVDGYRPALPFPLSRGERVALAFARALVAPLTGTPVARDFDKLFERLAGRHAPRGEQQGQLFARIWPLLSTPSSLAIDYSKHTAVIETLWMRGDRGARAKKTLGPSMTVTRWMLAPEEDQCPDAERPTTRSDLDRRQRSLLSDRQGDSSPDLR